MLSEKIEINITKYLANELSTSELKAFEEKLANDTALQEAVEFEQMVIDGIKQVGEQDLRAKLEVYHNEMNTTTKVRPLFSTTGFKMALMAASLLLLFSFSFWLLNKGFEVESITENKPSENTTFPKTPKPDEFTRYLNYTENDSINSKLAPNKVYEVDVFDIQTKIAVDQLTVKIYNPIKTVYRGIEITPVYHYTYFDCVLNLYGLFEQCNISVYNDAGYLSLKVDARFYGIEEAQGLNVLVRDRNR